MIVLASVVILAASLAAVPTIAALFAGAHLPYSITNSLSLIAHLTHPSALYPVGTHPVPSFLDTYAALVLVVVILVGVLLAGYRLYRYMVGGTKEERSSLLSAKHKERENRSLGARSAQHKGIIYGDKHFGRYDEPVLVVGQPGTGKSAWLVRNILSTPGPAFVTSIKPELFVLTAGQFLRQSRPVWVFDTDGAFYGALCDHAPEMVLRWDPLLNMATPSAARKVAKRFAHGAQLSSEDRHWEVKAADVLTWLLLAASLGRYKHSSPSPGDGLGLRDLRRWVFDRSTLAVAMQILEEHGYAEGRNVLADTLGNTDGGGYSASVQGVVASALDGFVSDDLVSICSPTGSETFSVKRWIEDRGVIYITGSAESQGAVQGVVAAMVEDLLEQARNYSQPLRPPLLLWLDEVANIARLGSLANIYTAGRGEGICPVAVVQSISQLVEGFGPHHAQTIRQAAVAELVYGGSKDIAMLRDIEQMSGEMSLATLSTSRGDQAKTVTKSERYKPRLSVDAIRSLPQHNS
ncbi:MAG: type IV secretion system DNA-binding domain-containing protein, partial [Actinobacteria bacterium]|nr:type IV secretion system DNA-binding domain-containing protein [Actinomycetota bacterium]